jgi:hypothetical protein
MAAFYSSHARGAAAATAAKPARCCSSNGLLSDEPHNFDACATFRGSRARAAAIFGERNTGRAGASDRREITRVEAAPPYLPKMSTQKCRPKKY